MADFVRAGQRLVNLQNVVEIRVSEALPERYDEYGVWMMAEPLRADVVTTANTSQWNDGGDSPEFKHTEHHPYSITLRGFEAEEFLDSVRCPSRYHQGYRPTAYQEMVADKATASGGAS